ncbi:hypothetical protein H8356DRAFT_1626291 [Neocallimastix lanati (nom. inval.)]|nr:hypothetical protein H8356DRAFT_1626291 [Neocallimastix sp. JGI-2020a]
MCFYIITVYIFIIHVRYSFIFPYIIIIFFFFLLLINIIIIIIIIIIIKKTIQMFYVFVKFSIN